MARNHRLAKLIGGLAALTAAIVLPGPVLAQTPSAAITLDPHAFARAGEIDPRFQSFNIEMAQITGGNFWAPYGGASTERYSYQGPDDLSVARLRNLTKALSPAYVRVSGTWANSTYLLGEGEAAPAEPPPGFRQVLTRDQWRGVVAFAKALDLEIVTSFAASVGTRDDKGVWRTDQAKRLLDLTREAGGRIAAAEFINEPNLSGAPNSALPPNYGAADWSRDFAAFAAFMAKASPETKLLGPGSTSDTLKVAMPYSMIENDGLMDGLKGQIGGVSYHFYGALSERCRAIGGQTTADRALTAGWLDLTKDSFAYFQRVRDKFAPGKPIWLTETGQAACGGSPWAATFRDTFRYVDQMGALARLGVQMVAHNTLSRSDYGLIDSKSLEPRPSFWAAVLWRRLMGTTVLAAPASPSATLRLYAHCLRHGRPGSVAVLALNLSPQEQTLTLRGPSRLYLLTASELDSRTIALNGGALAAKGNGELPPLASVKAGSNIPLPPQSIAFVALDGAGNSACK